MNMNLSPSLYHKRLMWDLVPSMTWRGQEVFAWQRELRVKLEVLLGLDFQTEARVPLNVRSFWRRKHELGIIEKIVLSSEKDVDISAYVCLPVGAKPPYTFFICLQGHSTGMHNSIGVSREDEAREIPIEGDRGFAIGCMRQGLGALCIEQRSLGERVETVQPIQTSPPMSPCHDAAMQALFLGHTLLGERVFDLERAIDYLATRGDCDMSRIGIMGNSGGGTTSLFAGALLPRIRYVMASSCFSSFKASIMSLTHCVCNYVPGMMRVAEMGDIAGLIAPKPLIVVSGDEDGGFPIDAAREEFQRTQDIYAAAGAKGECQHLICRGGHRFYADAAWACFNKLVK